EISDKEMNLANMLIDSMADKYQPEKYKDEYYEKVLEVIRAKVEGVAPRVPTAKAKAPGHVVDLMEILKESLKEPRKKGGRAEAEEEEEQVGVAPSRGRSKRPRKAG